MIATHKKSVIPISSYRSPYRQSQGPTGRRRRPRSAPPQKQGLTPHAAERIPMCMPSIPIRPRTRDEEWWVSHLNHAHTMTVCVDSKRNSQSKVRTLQGFSCDRCFARVGLLAKQCLIVVVRVERSASISPRILSVASHPVTLQIQRQSSSLQLWCGAQRVAQSSHQKGENSSCAAASVRLTQRLQQEIRVRQLCGLRRVLRPSINATHELSSCWVHPMS